jgi:c-di-GMP phosphodiesterase
VGVDPELSPRRFEAPQTALTPAPVADLVIARQPILDRELRPLGFELLYRPIESNGQPLDPARATATVLGAALTEIGLDALVGSAPAFINITREFLLELRPLPMPPGRVVLELAGPHEVDAELIAVLEDLSAQGFALALAGFAYRSDLEPLLALARYVKLDVRRLDAAALTSQVQRLRGRHLKLVAEKVESGADFELCKALGFDAFQGYFFARPDVIRRERTPTFRLDTLAGVLSADEDAFEALEEIICRDAGLSHKLLRLANSAQFAGRTRVGSIRQALTVLGSRTVRRWVMVLALVDGRNAFDELLLTALIRARMCELLARSGEGAEADRAFTAGLLSVVDALMGEPLPDLVRALPFDGRLVDALLDHQGPEGRILAAVLAYEGGFFQVAAEVAPDLRALARRYYDALEWAYEFVVAMT